MRIEIPRKYTTWNEIIKVTARHWAMKKKIFDSWHNETYWIIKSIKNKPELPFKNKVALEVTVKCKDKRKRDPDGVCIKPILDSMVKSGVLEDDNSNFVSSVKVTLLTGTGENCVIIDILE